MEEEVYEFIQDEDLGEAEKLAEALSEKLGEDYIVTAKLEDW
ncbi:hypothetical protein [Halocola ammonii]